MPDNATFIHPDFKYTTLQFNRNFVCTLHVNSNNHGPSYIMALGPYTDWQMIDDDSHSSLTNLAEHVVKAWDEQQRTDRRQWERPASELRKELDRCLGDPMSYSWGVTIFIAGNSHLLDVEDSASELNDLWDVEERDVSTHLHRSS